MKDYKSMTLPEPDNTGFLFEVDDDMYWIHELLWIVFLELMVVFASFYVGVVPLLESRHGLFIWAIAIGAPLKFLYDMYRFSHKRDKKIKFYTDSVYRTNKQLSIPISNKQELYISEYWLAYGYFKRVSQQRQLITITILFPLFLWLVLAVALTLSFVAAVKRMNTYPLSNLIIVDNERDRVVSIPLALRTEEEKKLISLYLEQYCGRPLDRIEQRFHNIPEKEG